MVLEPLRESKRTFDKIMFINDVIFSVLHWWVVNLGRRRDEIVTCEIESHSQTKPERMYLLAVRPTQFFFQSLCVDEE
jgi:hypothetical protein